MGAVQPLACVQVQSCEPASLPTTPHALPHRHRHTTSCPACPALQDQDDWVPMDVVRDLVAALHASSAKLLADICPADELNWQEL